MIKKAFILIIASMFTGVNLYAADGDIIVDNKVGVGVTESELQQDTYFKIIIKDDNKFINLGTSLNVAGISFNESTELLSVDGLVGYDYSANALQISSDNSIKLMTNWPLGDNGGNLALFADTNGNVGIGTAAPQSSLQVNGYVQLGLTPSAPPEPDCDEASEYGRMKVDSDGNGSLYICVQNGWRKTILTQ